MRRLLALLLIGICSVLSANEAEMLKYLPASPDMVFFIDVDRILQNPVFSRELDSEQLFSTRPAEALDGFKISDLSAMLFTGRNDRYVAYLKFKSADKVRQLVGQNSGKLKKGTAGGFVTYNILSAPSENFVLLKPDLIACCSDRYINAVVKPSGVQDGAKILASLPAGERAAAWMAMDDLFGISGGQASKMIVTYSFTGKDNADHLFKMVTECADKKQAAQLAVALPGFFQLALGALFGEDPQLGLEICRSISADVDGKRVTVTLPVPQPLALRVIDFAKKQVFAEYPVK